MTVRYCGPGGSDANNGLTWATRKLTLNGVEDTPVVAGDLVHVAPGVYRETLTVDVSGSAGNTIEYRADVDGSHTDGVGGIVRITGSDNDQTVTRTNAITASSKNYRTFTGFVIDTTGSFAVSLTDCTNWIIQDCTFVNIAGTAINVAGGSQASTTVRRCVIFATLSGIAYSHSATVNDTAHLIENCIILAGATTFAVSTTRVGGITVKNSSILSGSAGVRVGVALAVGQTVTVYDCIVTGCSTALTATTTAEFVEDYNTVFNNGTARSNVNTGANSVAHSPLFAPPILLAGIRYPWTFGALSQWSTLAAKAGTGEASDDLFGTTRPATSSKKSWGAVQFENIQVESTTVRSGKSRKQADACDWQARRVPVTNVSTTISVYTRWEADYAGTKPQMVIRQPGQADITVTALGLAGAWEQLTHTFTPAALPPYVLVILRSNNSATLGSYSTYWDDFRVA